MLIKRPKVTAENYFDAPINQAYFNQSQIKRAHDCMAGWKAERDLEHTPEEKKRPIELGTYADLALTDTPINFERWKQVNAKLLWKWGKEANGKAQDIIDLDDAIAHARRDATWMKYLTGKQQVVLYFDDFHGFPFRCKLDNLSFEEAFIDDLKTCRGVNETMYNQAFRRRVSWIEERQYGFQAALYQDAVYQKYGFMAKYYINALEKKYPFRRRVFDLTTDPDPMSDYEQPNWRDVFSQHIADAVETMGEMQAAIDTPCYQLPRCEECDYCEKTKMTEAPTPYIHGAVTR